MRDDDAVVKVIDIEKLIKSDPERYSIITSPEDAEQGKVTEIGGNMVQIIQVDYLRPGLCVIDNQPVIKQEQKHEQKHKQSNSDLDLISDSVESGNNEALPIPDILLKEERLTAPNELGYIDVLSENCGDMVIRRLNAKSENGNYTVIELESLPIVFIGKSLVECFKKLVKFILDDIFILIKIMENRNLRQNMKQSIAELIENKQV